MEVSGEPGGVVRNGVGLGSGAFHASGRLSLHGEAVWGLVMVDLAQVFAAFWWGFGAGLVASFLRNILKRL